MCIQYVGRNESSQFVYTFGSPYFHHEGTRPLQRLLLHILNAYLLALSITVQAERALSRFVTALLSMAKPLQ